MGSPLNMIRIEDIKNFRTGIVYGEYWANEEKEEVNIFQKQNEWKKIYSFGSGEIKHIHNIVLDKYRDGILVLTGDADNESGILLCRNNFQETYWVVSGSQKYRTCVAYAEKDGILYATDTPMEKNGIYILRQEEREWKETQLYKLPGPCIYA